MKGDKQVMIDFVRKVLPIRIRQDLGLWSLAQSARCKALLYPYFLLLCGDTPKNLTLLPYGECSVNYNGREVLAPRDGILAFIEVFQDKIYEKLWSPKEGDTVLDAGAYVGMFTVRASELVGKSGRVIAIEPEPRNFAYLERNTEGLGNVTLIKAIASSWEGKGRLYLSGASPCHTTAYKHRNSIEIRQITLDSLNTKADFVKIDAEGAELDILGGAEKLLSMGTRLAIACYHDLPKGGNELPLVADFLRQRNYRITALRKYIYAEPPEVNNVR